MFGNTGKLSAYSRFAQKEASAFVAATPDNLRKLEYWLQDVFLDSGTDPRQAISRAYAMSPDAIFLLSDGSFNRPRRTIAGEGWTGQFEIPPDASVYEGVELAMSDIPIHTIAFENAFTRETMKGIAEVTGGSNRYVKTPSLEPKAAASLVNALQQIGWSQRFRNAGPETQHLIRLRYARTLIEDGELAFAEYLLRPTRDFRFRFQGHREQVSEMFDIVSSELGEVRVEDFKSVSLAEIERQVKRGRPIPRF